MNVCRVRLDLEQKLTEDADFFVENTMCWYRTDDKACVDLSITVEQVLDPPALCLRPDQTKLFPGVEWETGTRASFLALDRCAWHGSKST